MYGCYLGLCGHLKTNLLHKFIIWNFKQESSFTILTTKSYFTTCSWTRWAKKSIFLGALGVVVDVLDNPLEDVDVFEPKAELLALLNELWDLE